jgi:phosphoribosylglycinamide formyltransferase-1
MRARALGVPVAVVARAACPDRATFERELDAALAQARPAVIALAGFMRVLSAGFVARWAGRILNIHPSLLPAYPGLDTHARALAAGDAWAGCTVHEVTADLDAGPIRGQGRVPILPGDSAETLAARVLEMEHRLYPAVLRRFCAGARDRIDLI